MMLMPRPNFLAIVVPMVLFLATFIRSTFGFVAALISVPLLGLMIPVKVAAPLAVLASITVASIVVARCGGGRRHIFARRCRAIFSMPARW